MGCCALCSSKKKTSSKKTNHITAEKVNAIDNWIETIEGPCDLVELVTKPIEEPKIISNQDEQMQIQDGRSRPIRER